MEKARAILFILTILLITVILWNLCVSQAEAQLPSGVKVVWDVEKAYREKTPTRERVCLNGLWRWQPAVDVTKVVPNDNWGYFKVLGSWPGITDYVQKDSPDTLFSSELEGRKLARHHCGSQENQG